MYHFLLFVHVISAVLLGSYLVLPWQIKKMTALSGNALTNQIALIQSYTRAGHLALIFLLLSGGSMIGLYSAYPSILWVVVSIGAFMLIGAAMGMLQKKLRQLKEIAASEERLQKDIKGITILSWLLCGCILFALLIMTNPSIFS